MNLPNKLTVGRLFVTLIFVGAMAVPSGFAHTLSLALFVIASITDYLDGEIARRCNLITNFGKLMDPLVDKILIAAAFVMLSAKGVFPAWAVVIILAREFLVTGLRLLATAQGAILAADVLGKWKTTFQIITAIYLLLNLSSTEPAFRWLRPFFELPFFGPNQLGLVLVFITLAVTVISGWNYLWSNRGLIDSH